MNNTSNQFVGYKVNLMAELDELRSSCILFKMKINSIKEHNKERKENPQEVKLEG